MARKIQTITVNYGDYSRIYRVGDILDHPGWSEVTSIKLDQHDTQNYDRVTYNVFAQKADLSDDEEHLAIKIGGLPVELSYNADSYD